MNQYNTDKQNLEKTMRYVDKNTRYKWFSDENCFEYKNYWSWEQNTRYK